MGEQFLRAVKCDECGQPLQAGNVQIGADKCLRCVTLQLLVIDLGDCCVVKVEMGYAAFNRHTASKDKFFPPIHNVDQGEPLITGNKWLDNRQFSEIRRIVDALGGKPRHYIENRSDDEFPDYWLVWHCPPASAGCMPTCGEVRLGGDGAMEGLAALAGKPLPIYEGSGTWVRLYAPDADANFQLFPLSAWRYTR